MGSKGALNDHIWVGVLKVAGALAQGKSVGVNGVVGYKLLGTLVMMAALMLLQPR